MNTEGTKNTEKPRAKRTPKPPKQLPWFMPERWDQGIKVKGDPDRPVSKNAVAKLPPACQRVWKDLEPALRIHFEDPKRSEKDTEDLIHHFLYLLADLSRDFSFVDMCRDYPISASKWVFSAANVWG